MKKSKSIINKTLRMIALTTATREANTMCTFIVGQKKAPKSLGHLKKR